MTAPNYFHARQDMVERQLKSRGIVDSLVLASFLNVPREEFIPLEERSFSYQDGPLPIGEGQTISQPYIVALMTQAASLTAKDRVLEIGTGSGYQAAILSYICKSVYTVERFVDLLEKAKQTLDGMGRSNIFFRVGDGSLGWQEEAPYDAILVTAAAPSVPPALLQQLKVGGRLIIPVGDERGQTLERIRRVDQEEFLRETLEYVRFVPLVGEEGW